MTDAGPHADTDAMKAGAQPAVPAPELPWRAPAPVRDRPRIGLIGTGAISCSGLAAYRAAEHCALPRVVESWPDLRADPGIDAVDEALPPEHRTPIIEAARRAGKHVLSEKRFVDDLEAGAHLIEQARGHGLQPAVNQAGRWVPHLAWMRTATEAGNSACANLPSRGMAVADVHSRATGPDVAIGAARRLMV